MVAHEREGLKHLTREATNETCREPVEIVRLDELIEVDAQQFHRNAKMTTEVEVFSHLDDMVLLFRIL